MAGEFSLALQAVQLGTQLIGGAISNYKGHENALKSSINSYKSSLENANEYIKKAQATYNTTRDKIINNYGASTFSILEKQYNEINGLNSTNSLTTGGLKSYNLENSQENLFDRDQKVYSVQDKVFSNNVSNYEAHHFKTNDLNSSVVDQLYNSLSSGDTALAQQLRLSGNQMASMLQTAQDEVSQTLSAGNSALKQNALQARSQRLSNSLEVASSRASMASSGVRNTGTGNANESLTRLQADITDAYYAMNIQSQAVQLQNEIYNTQKSASLSAYQTRASIELQKRQAYESVVSAYGGEVKTGEEYVNSANGLEETANEYADYSKELAETSFLEKIFGLY